MRQANATVPFAALKKTALYRITAWLATAGRQGNISPLESRHTPGTQTHPHPQTAAVTIPQALSNCAILC